jgi:DNA-directed RNA polymerase subunit RPC12/RpoP
VGAGTVADVASLTVCPSCGSGLVQPLRWEQRTAAQVLVELRCPECSTRMQACHTPAEMQDLDRRQTEARDAIVSAYECSVRESMHTLAADLHEALARDLIGADDFRPALVRRRAA